MVMDMKIFSLGKRVGVGLVLAALASCTASEYKVVSVETRCLPVDSVWDAAPDSAALALLAPYQIDSVMNAVIGQAAVSMDRFRPESPLSNLIADVLRQSAAGVLGRPADVAIMNIGGIRNVLSQGNVTCGDVFEILPFENSLCVLTLKGSVLKQVFANMASRGGEGLSGAQLRISADGKLLDARVGGKPMQDEALYTVSTIDFLAEGNDGLTALRQAQQRQCPPNAVLRDVFMDYVKRETAAGRPLTARIEGRIIVEH